MRCPLLPLALRVWGSVSPPETGGHPAPGSVRGCTLWPAVATRGRCGLKKGYILPQRRQI